MIADLGVVVALRVVRVGETVDDFVLGAEVGHMLTHEVGSIVGDDNMRKSEATNNVLLKKIHYMLSCDFGERHRLYPFGKVFGGYQEEPELCQSSRERTHYI